mmetsp:Transcript_103632/g.317298  ORF Transcript_103632/g.317298 Transcript_103632/m.317298 type:complete len:286 (-) Transcript_103632:95-952(-)
MNSMTGSASKASLNAVTKRTIFLKYRNTLSNLMMGTMPKNMASKNMLPAAAIGVAFTCTSMRRTSGMHEATSTQLKALVRATIFAGHTKSRKTISKANIASMVHSMIVASTPIELIGGTDWRKANTAESRMKLGMTLKYQLAALVDSESSNKCRIHSVRALWFSFFACNQCVSRMREECRSCAEVIDVLGLSFSSARESLLESFALSLPEKILAPAESFWSTPRSENDDSDRFSFGFRDRLPSTSIMETTEARTAPNLSNESSEEHPALVSSPAPVSTEPVGSCG